MIDYRDWQQLAVDLVQPPNSTEIAIRRAISAAYYGLFHRLTTAGAEAFRGGGVTLERQVSRAYSHSAMKNVCARYARSPKQPLDPKLQALNDVAFDSRLPLLADAFCQLQEARQLADYDVGRMIDHPFGLDTVQLAAFAHERLDEIAGRPETMIFLSALLLADRWSKGG